MTPLHDWSVSKQHRWQRQVSVSDQACRGKVVQPTLRFEIWDTAAKHIASMLRCAWLLLGPNLED